MVFMEGHEGHKFQYQGNTCSDFLNVLWRKNIMAMKIEPHECVIFVQFTKIVTHENNVIHSIFFVQFHKYHY